MNESENLERWDSLAQAGVDAAGVKAFIDAVEAEKYHVHSLTVTKGGKIAWECSWAPYRLEEHHHMHSFTKSLVASCIGILEGQGRVRVDDPVISYFPEYQIPDPTGRLARMTLWNLLTMTSGHDAEPNRHGCEDETYAFLSMPMVYEPGTHFKYSSMGTNVLSAIVKRVSGFDLDRFLNLYLLEPMGIHDIRFDTCVSGRCQGGGGSFLRAEDMAKFSVLFLQKGRWKGRQLIPEDWISRMTSCQFAASRDESNPDWEDWKQGYGFQLWMCSVPGVYRFDGMYGQWAIMIPSADASVMLTCGEAYTEAILRLVWKFLVPALGGCTAPEPERARAEEALRQQKRTLAIDWPMNHEIAPEQAAKNTAALDGVCLRFPENRESLLPRGRVANCYTSGWTEAQRDGIRKLSFAVKDGELLVSCEDNKNRNTFAAGLDGAPVRGRITSLWGDYDIWAAARWNRENGLELQVRPVNGEYYQIFTVRPGGTAAVVAIGDGPWDRRRPKPEDREYVCEKESN